MFLLTFEKTVCNIGLITVRKGSLRRLCFYTCLSFCSQGGSASVHAGIPPGTRHTPPPQRRPPRADTPQEQTPPPGADPPPTGSRDGYCCGRYASYWNAFLFLLYSLSIKSDMQQILDLTENMTFVKSGSRVMVLYQ